MRFKVSSRKVILLLLLFSVTYKDYAQENTSKPQSYSFEFQFFGKAGLLKESTEQMQFTYDLSRTLIIYRQNFSKSIDLFVAGDTYVKDEQKPYSLTPYLKRAYFQYQNHNLSISAGLLVMEQYKYQRKLWQLRYIDKTFQNKFRYGENRNIGFLVKHHVSSRFSYDFALATGYNTPIQYYSGKFSLLAGQTIESGFCSFRLFNSITIDPYFEHVVTLFIGKELRKSNYGLEAAKKYSNIAEPDANQYGFSIFGNHELSKNAMCFARYDINRESSVLKHSENIWVGIQFSFEKLFKTSIYYKNKDIDTHFFGIGLYIHYDNM